MTVTPWERAVRVHRALDSEEHGHDETMCETEACNFVAAEIEEAVQLERVACAREMCALCRTERQVPLVNGGRFHENAERTFRRPCRASPIHQRARQC